jgi:dTDP-4-amino-4,6-dideoxygalactose transaminase
MNDIPFLDLVTPHRELKDELHGVFQYALETAGFIGGAQVEEFEREFAAFCEAKHCVGVANGTDALRFSLIAAGIQPGDGVITVPNTFIATTEAISQAGASPEFVDINERTYNMDPQKLQEYLERTCYFDGRKAINRKNGKPVTGLVPVHLYGQMAEMDPIIELARRYNLTVIEDACQAHGAEYFSEKEGRWMKAGSMGIAAAFSFYPGKNLGACGEGGAVTTNDPKIAQRIRMIRDHGQARKYYHDMEGYNGRLDAIQAGILRIKLKQLTGWNEKRRENAHRYNKLLQTCADSLGLPYVPTWAKAVYHLYVIRVQNRDQLQKHLGQAHIGTGIHYPIPLHLQKAYHELYYEEGAFPVAEKVAKEILSLPMFPGLDERQQSRVADEVLNFVGTEVSDANALAASA